MRGKGDDVSPIELCFHLFYKLEFLYVFIKKEKKKREQEKGDRGRERENFDKNLEIQQIPSSCNRRMLALKRFV